MRHAFRDYSQVAKDRLPEVPRQRVLDREASGRTGRLPRLRRMRLFRRIGQAAFVIAKVCFWLAAVALFLWCAAIILFCAFMAVLVWVNL